MGRTLKAVTLVAHIQLAASALGTLACALCEEAHEPVSEHEYRAAAKSRDSIPSVRPGVWSYQ